MVTFMYESKTPGTHGQHTHTQYSSSPCVQRRHKIGGGADDSVVKSTQCSSEGPRFNSLKGCHIAHSDLQLQLQGLQCFLPVPAGTELVYKATHIIEK